VVGVEPHLDTSVPGFPIVVMHDAPNIASSLHQSRFMGYIMPVGLSA
jgi:hypothetical protein